MRSMSTPPPHAAERLRRSLQGSDADTIRALDGAGLVLVRRDDLRAMLDAQLLQDDALPYPDAVVEAAEQAAADVLENRARYFESTRGHFDRADAARSLRATADDVRKAVRTALAEPREPTSPRRDAA